MIFDDDAVAACADLVGRTGATRFEVGFLHDDVAADQAGWYAHAMFKGARISIGDQPGPVEACDALVRRLLDGARCAHCHALVSLSSAAGASCRWRRMGARWVRGCEVAR